MIDLDLRLLRYFVVVVRAGGFTAAADSLHVSQPALSQGIKRLEGIIGADLLVRANRGSRRVTLTEVGESLYPDAVDLLQRSERAVRQARDRTARTPIRCGFSPNTPRDLVRATLDAGQHLSDVELDFQQVEWGDEESRLLWGGVDLIFMLQLTARLVPTIDSATLRAVRRVACFPATHRLALAEHLVLADLRDEPIIDAGSDRDFWLALPRPDGAEPPIVGRPAKTVEEMLAAVSSGQGMAITTETVAEKHIAHDLAFIPIADLSPAWLVIARLRDDRRPGVVALFDAIIAEHGLDADRNDSFSL